MGKIFGISDNPVATIESALKGMYSVEPPIMQEIKTIKETLADRFVSSAKNVSKSKTSTPKFVRKMLSFFKK